MNQEIDQPILNSTLVPHAVAYPCFIHYNSAGIRAKIDRLTNEKLSLAIDSDQEGLYNRYY